MLNLKEIKLIQKEADNYYIKNLIRQSTTKLK